MDNVILCNGKYAANPFFIEEDNLHIYSVEELCYYLYKNAFLIQEDFFSEELLEWMDKELGLAEWVGQLKLLKGKEEELLCSMEYLFLRTGYYGEADVKHVRGVLKDNNHLSVAERKKLRADAYCKKQRYAKASAEYEQLLKETEAEQVRFRAKLYHNLGVCSAGMFLYEKAAECFEQAFHEYPNTESYVQFLMAKKLGCSREEYLSYLADHPESYEDSLEVESRLTRVEQAWEKTPFNEMLQDMMEEERATYYSTIKKLVAQAKADYIKMVDKR